MKKNMTIRKFNITKNNIEIKILGCRNITFEQLRTFVSIAEFGSFIKAGEELARTQSALSIGLKRLEENIGCKLIERKQGIIIGLTKEGKQLLPQASDILMRMNSAITSLTKNQLEGKITLGIPDDFNITSLYKIISLCLKENPELHIEVTAAPSSILSEMVKKQLLDIVIIRTLNGQFLLPESEFIINIEPLLWVSSCLFNFNKIVKIPLVTFHKNCIIRNCAIAALEQIKRSYYLSYVSNSFDNVKNAISLGLGIGLLPRNAIPDGVNIISMYDGAPSVPSIQLVLKTIKSGELYESFSHYLIKELS